MTCPGLPRAGIRTQAVVSRSWNPLSLPRPSHFTRYKCPGTSCPGKGHGAQPQQRCPASSLGRFRSTCLSPACSRPGAQVDEMGGVSWKRVQRALQGWGRQSLEREKQPRCPSADEWMHKMWSVPTMEHDLAIKGNEVPLHATTQAKLEKVVLLKEASGVCTVGVHL